jgi:MEMO1 family protein
MNLDFMPSPLEDRPGLLIRDSFQYAEATLIIPGPLVSCLTLLDGERTGLDMREHLVNLTGRLDVSDIQANLVQTLSDAGFLENEVYEEMREARHREFAENEVRAPAHAGSAYPEDEEEAREVMLEYMAGAKPAPAEPAIAIAAPHVSPFGGYESYRDAYSALKAGPDTTFVILGTSHYGHPDRFGLTRKRFVTPLGEARTHEGMVNALASQPAVLMEDYCHAIEHSIEFQVLFLQYLFGPSITIVPILCGTFLRSIYEGGAPEENEEVKRFFDGLGEAASKERDLRWVLGIDMAHMGARYGGRWRDAGGGGSRQGSHRERVERRRRGLLVAGAGESRRLEVVRIGAAVYLLARLPRGSRGDAAVSAVEHRPAERGEFRGAIVLKAVSCDGRLGTWAV